MDERPFCLRPPTRAAPATCVAALLLLLANACATVGGNPEDWPTTGEHPDFPPQRYVVGVGWGDTMDVADDRARGEIAKFFKARVVSVTREEEHWTQAGSDELKTTARVFESRTHARVRGEAVFDDAVEIVQRTLRQGTHYTLAALDKLAMRRRLEKELADVEMEMAERMETPPDPAATRVRALARALYLHHRRVELARKLELLGRKVVVDHEERNRTAHQLRKLLADHFPIVVEGNDAELDAMVGAALREAALVVARPAEDRAPITVRVGLDLDLSAVDGLARVHYRVRLEAVQDGELLAKITAEERISHPDAALADAKARVEIGQRAIAPFVQQLQHTLLGDFDAEEEKK
jgi:hypothetical protein